LPRCTSNFSLYAPFHVPYNNYNTLYYLICFSTSSCIEKYNLSSFASVLVSLWFVTSLFDLCTFLANSIRPKWKMGRCVTTTSLVPFQYWDYCKISVFILYIYIFYYIYSLYILCSLYILYEYICIYFFILLIICFCVYAMPISWNQFMKWTNSCVHKHFFMNSITHESWLWIQPQFTKCWGTAHFPAYYSIELYIKFKQFDSFTNIILWICLCCINRGYYNFMYWRMHEIHSIIIVCI